MEEREQSGEAGGLGRDPAGENGAVRGEGAGGPTNLAGDSSLHSEDRKGGRCPMSSFL